MGSPPFWLTAFLDYPEPDFAAATGFWSAVTGYAVSPARGAHEEFATLVPPTGDGYLKVQRVGDREPRLHLDLHVADPAAATEHAAALGATPVRRDPSGYVVLDSPGGLTFCLVRHPAALTPAPTAWADGHRSRVYQVCLDLPASTYDAEAAFWAGLLAASLQTYARRPEFGWLRAARPRALGVLVQRLEEPAGRVRAHLDLGTNNRAAEVARHRRLGAEVVAIEESWTVLRDPGGLRYCVTDRDPAAGTPASDGTGPAGPTGGTAG